MLTTPEAFQLILAPAKRNPSFCLYTDADEKKLHVYCGLELLEVVPRDRDSPAYRLLAARLYNIATVETIRTDFLILPAKLVRRSKWNLVKLPKGYPYRKEFARVAGAIKKLKLPGKFRICRKEAGRKIARGAKVAQKP